MSERESYRNPRVNTDPRIDAKSRSNFKSIGLRITFPLSSLALAIAAACSGGEGDATPTHTSQKTRTFTPEPTATLTITPAEDLLEETTTSRVTPTPVEVTESITEPLPVTTPISISTPRSTPIPTSTLEPPRPTPTPTPTPEPPLPTPSPTPQLEVCNTGKFTNLVDGQTVSFYTDVKAQLGHEGNFDQGCELPGNVGVNAVLIDTYGHDYSWALYCGYTYPVSQPDWECFRNGVIIADITGARWKMELEIGDQIVQSISIIKG